MFESLLLIHSDCNVLIYFPEWLHFFLQSVLNLLLRLGQSAVSNTSFAQEYDNMQYSLAEFYCTCMDESKNLNSVIQRCNNADLSTVNALIRPVCMLQEMYLMVLLFSLIEVLRSFLFVAFIISLLWIPFYSSHLLGLAYVSTSVKEFHHETSWMHL